MLFFSFFFWISIFPVNFTLCQNQTVNGITLPNSAPFFNLINFIIPLEIKNKSCTGKCRKTFLNALKKSFKVLSTRCESIESRTRVFVERSSNQASSQALDSFEGEKQAEPPWGSWQNFTFFFLLFFYILLFFCIFFKYISLVSCAHLGTMLFSSSFVPYNLTVILLCKFIVEFCRSKIPFLPPHPTPPHPTLPHPTMP